MMSPHLTMDLPHPLMSPEEHNEQKGETKAHLMGTRVSQRDGQAIDSCSTLIRTHPYGIQWKF